MLPYLPFPFPHFSFFQPMMEVKMIRWEVEEESSEDDGGLPMNNLEGKRGE
jgi:hypothetical protein